MRTIKWSTEFKKDYRRIKASPRHANDVDELLTSVVELLANDTPLPESNRDHALTGNWKGYRECHIKPDLLLIYQPEALALLRMVRLGSHSELFSR